MVYQGYDPDYFEKPAIITVATTGGFHGKEANPDLPEQPEEIAEDVRKCEEAGASIVHLHARDEDGVPTKDVGYFQEIRDRIDEACDDILVNFTSAGDVFTVDECMAPLLETEPRPDLAALDMGPMNVSDTAFTAEQPRAHIQKRAELLGEHGIKPELELFHPGQVSEVHNLIEKDLLEPPYFCQIIFGMQTGAIANPGNVLNFVENLPEPCEWECMAIGRHQLPLTTLSLVLGGHVRVGLEDNIFYDRGELATNVSLVERTSRIASELNRSVATPDQARELLGTK